MDFQQIVILVATILGWVLVAGSLGFGVVIISKIYSSRDKEAAAERKRLEEIAKKAKKAKKKGQTVDLEEEKKPEIPKPSKKADEPKGKLKRPTLPPRPQQAMKGFEAPKRENVVRNLAESIETSSMRPGASFLDNEMDEFDLARKQAENKDSSKDDKPSTNNGFPPPPPRL